MPHFWLDKLEKLREPLDECFSVIEFYVNRAFEELLAEGKLRIDERREWKWHRRELIIEAGLNGYFKWVSDGLKETIEEVNKLWSAYHMYLASVGLPFSSFIRQVEESIKVLRKLHEEGKYPSEPFVWNSNLGQKEKENMVKVFLLNEADKKTIEKVIAALDAGDEIYGTVKNISWINAFAVYLPALDRERANFYLREAELIVKYFDLSDLFYCLIERRKKPDWDSGEWLSFISRIRDIFEKSRV